MPERTPILSVEALRVAVPVHDGMRRILRDVSLDVLRGEILGIVGESGSGKSMTVRAALGLLPSGAEVGGSIAFDGQPIERAGAAELRAIRQRRISMVFQDPRASVNPVRTCGSQLEEVLRVNGGLSRKAARARARLLLVDVGIAEPERVLRSQPAQLSGGMLQRVMIAAALALEPELIVADEATTALDTTTQAEVVKLFDRLRREHGTAFVFITHDLDLAAAICDRIAVMYAGSVVEIQPARALFAHPAHPYTAALLRSRPRLDARLSRLAVIPGRPAHPDEEIVGCRFHPRCSMRVAACTEVVPMLEQVGRPQRLTACLREQGAAEDTWSEPEGPVVEA